MEASWRNYSDIYFVYTVARKSIRKLTIENFDVDIVSVI